MSALGFDTSNYTASAAWTDGRRDDGERSILSVRRGERGIRQSEGVFMHVKLLPELFERLSKRINLNEVRSVGVSTRPRSKEGSYMPVFLVGEGFGRAVSASLGVPLYSFSHQDGHIMAGIYSSGAFRLLNGDFISVHISGGTTEILKSRYECLGFRNTILGATKDISAGQFIDRIGVALGLDFPAGAELERLSKDASDAVKLPVSVDGCFMSFSGPETKTSRMIKDADRADIAAGVIKNVADALVKTINNAIKETKIHDVLIVGGVASNGAIRNALSKELDGEVYFAEPSYSTDNAVGTACLARLAHGEE